MATDLSRIRQNYQEARESMSEMYRHRVLTYGPNAAILMLRSFDDLGELLRDYEECQGESPEP